MADPNALLDNTYDTSDILGAIPPHTDPYNDPRGYLADYLRRQDRLTPEASQALNRRSVLDGLFPEAQQMAGTALSYVPPPVWDYAAFIGPSGARNLANAKIRHADDWGGVNRLQAARGRPEWGSSSPSAMEAIWKEYGWTPEMTWGRYGAEPTMLQPATAVATPEFRVNEGMMRPMKMGEHTVRRGEGLLPDMVYGLDELLVAEPSLAKATANFAIDPTMPTGRGGTMVNPTFPGNIKRIGVRPTGYATSAVDAAGPNSQVLHDVALHELQHAAAMPQGVAAAIMESQKMLPIKGAEAERYLADALRQAEARVARLENDHHAAQSRPYSAMEEYLQAVEFRDKIKRKLEQTPGYVGYLNTAQERMAREGWARGSARLPEHREIIPGLVDTYQPGAMGPTFEQLNYDYAPLRAFEPPK